MGDVIHKFHAFHTLSLLTLVSLFGFSACQTSSCSLLQHSQSSLQAQTLNDFTSSDDSTDQTSFEVLNPWRNGQGQLAQQNNDDLLRKLEAGLSPSGKQGITTTGIGSELRAVMDLPNLSKLRPPMLNFKGGGRDNEGPTVTYTGGMSASGLRFDNKEFIALRVCTGKCLEESKRSAIVTGEFQLRISGHFSLEHVQEEIFSEPEGPADVESVGPEDARLDVINGRLFLVANVNTQIIDCPKQVRKMHFKWVGEAGSCMLKLPGEGRDTCDVDKNWVPIIPEGTENLLLVYSLNPFVVLRVNTTTCRTTQFTQRPMVWGSNHIDLAVRGSSRYVKGISVPEGTVYWALVHTLCANYVESENKFHDTYRTKISSILVRNNGDLDHLGVSCAVKNNFTGLPKYYEAYPMSIISFEPKEDSAHVTFHLDDRITVRSMMHGVGSYLKQAYSQWKQTGNCSCTLGDCQSP